MIAEGSAHGVRYVADRGAGAGRPDGGFQQVALAVLCDLRQAAVDKGEEVIVGVNRYRLDNEQPIDIMEIDNSAVRKAQIRRIEETKRRSDGGAVREALAALAE
ncbi:methylmalonyl-CoA mutase family protein, partial [Rhizobium ruizarguesonis]